MDTNQRAPGRLRPAAEPDPGRAAGSVRAKPRAASGAGTSQLQAGAARQGAQRARPESSRQAQSRRVPAASQDAAARPGARRPRPGSPRPAGPAAGRSRAETAPSRAEPRSRLYAPRPRIAEDLPPTRPQATPEPATRRAASPARPAGRPTLPRKPFALLVLALLGGGLICLLVINTTLGAASFRVSQLQSTGSNLSQQEQTLQQQIASEQSPSRIEQRAYQLGMREPVRQNFLDLAKRHYDQLSGVAGGPDRSSPPEAGTTTATTTSAAKKARPGR